MTDVEKHGKLLRNYKYDTFGNRVGMDNYVRGIKTIYEYDVLNRLKWQDISDNENVVHKTYTYDKRGNLTGEYRNGELLFGYSYNSMNRLEKAYVLNERVRGRLTMNFKQPLNQILTVDRCFMIWG